MERHQFIYRIHELKGALILGALLGGFAALFFAPLESGFRPALAWMLAGATAGATGASLVAISKSESLVFVLSVLPISGAVGGLAFWLVILPDAPMQHFVIGGALVVPLLFLFRAIVESLLLLAKGRRNDA